MSRHYITNGYMEDQSAKEMQRRVAIQQSGYAFIVLELLDKRKRRVSAVDDLVAKPGESGGYVFEVVSRQMQFDPDQSRGGIMTCHILDTEWNRKFLASHMDGNYWEVISVISGRKGNPITIESLLSDLELLKIELAESMVKHMPVRGLLPPDTKQYDIANIDIDVLEAELKRRKEQSKVDLKSIVSGGKKEKQEKITMERALTMSEEEFDSLSVGQKARVTRFRNIDASKMTTYIPSSRTKPAIVESARPPEVIEETIDGIKESSGLVDSEFVNTTPLGVVQP